MSKARSYQDHLIILGAQKAGTTTLHRWLASTDLFSISSQKEIHYFTLNYHLPWQWYLDQFNSDRNSKLPCLDSTPYYLFHPYAASRISKHCQHAKLIVLLRDPVARCLSQYFHAKRLGFEPLALNDALHAEPKRLADADDALAIPGYSHYSHQKHSYVSRSRYELQLARYQTLFHSDQLLILRSEDLFQTPHLVWARLQIFLSLNKASAPKALPISNAGNNEASSVDVSVITQLHEQLEPTYQACAELYGIHWQEHR